MEINKKIMEQSNDDFIKSIEEFDKNKSGNNWKKLIISFKFSIFFSLFFLVANLILIFYIVINPGWGSIILFSDYAVPINFPGFIVSTIMGFELGDSFFFAVAVTFIFYLLLGLLIDLIFHILKTRAEKIAQ